MQVNSDGSEVSDRTDQSFRLTAWSPELDDPDVLMCTECGHPAHVKPARHVLRRLFGMKIPAAYCTTQMEDASGWGTLPCYCTSPEHGS